MIKQECNCDCCEGITPTGAVMYFAMPSAPKGWLECDGSEVSIKEYHRLYQAIGDIYGKATCPDMFKLPDLRGEFIRGVDSGRGLDEGRKIGTSQKDMVGNHNHVVRQELVTNPEGRIQAQWVHGSHTGGSNCTVLSNVNNLNNINNFFASALVEFDKNKTATYVNNPENRPHNVALLACIKY